MRVVGVHSCVGSLLRQADTCPIKCCVRVAQVMQSNAFQTGSSRDLSRDVEEQPGQYGRDRRRALSMRVGSQACSGTSPTSKLSDSQPALARGDLGLHRGLDRRVLLVQGLVEKFSGQRFEPGAIPRILEFPDHRHIAVWFVCHAEALRVHMLTGDQAYADEGI
jgi:hypothetical protein